MGSTGRGIFSGRTRGARTSGNGGVDEQEVARIAHDLYVQRGRADGHDLEDWLKAEAIVRQRATGRLSKTR